MAQRIDLKEESELPHLGWVEIREAPGVMAQELGVLPSGLAIHPWWPSTKLLVSEALVPVCCSWKGESGPASTGGSRPRGQ